MKDIMLHMVRSRMFWGLIVSVAAEALKAHGIILDQQGIVNDLFSAGGVLMAVHHHVQFSKASVVDQQTKLP